MVEDILEDPYFNFGLRQHVFEKVLVKYYPQIKLDTTKFTELGKIRNIVAHALIKMRSDEEVDGRRTVTKNPFYAHGGSEHDCELLHAKYDQLKEVIYPILMETTGTEVIPYSQIITHK